MQELLSEEQARKEITGWLDHKKIKAKKRNDYKEIIDTLVESMQDGTLTIDEKFNMTQNLCEPIGDSGIQSLTYAPRATVGEVQEWTKGVKATDGEAKLLAIAAGLTGKAAVKDIAVATLKKMDSTDGGLLQSIIVFFM